VSHDVIDTKRKQNEETVKIQDHSKKFSK